MLDQLRRIKRGGDFNVVKIIETLEMELRFLRTFLEYHHLLLPDSFVNIAKKIQLIGEMIQSVFPDGCKTNLNVERLASHLLKFIEGNTSSRFNYELDDSYLLEYMDYLDKNLNDAPRYLLKSDPFLTKGIFILQKTDRFLKQVKFIQKKMRFLRYLYGTEINGHIDREKQKRLEIQMQLVADNVVHFCFALWTNEIDGIDTSNIENKPSYLICLVVLVELEMETIFRGELKASKFSHSRTQKLPKGFSHHLHSLLVYLRQKKLGNLPNNVSAQNIDAAVELLLDSLDDVSNSATNCKMLNEVLEKVGALVGDILCVIHSSTIKDDTSKMGLWSIQILTKTGKLKAQLLQRYYKLLKFTPSQFPTAGGLSFLDSLLLKLNEMLKSESGSDLKMKPHIGILEKEFSSLTSVFRDVAKVQHEHDIFKDLRQRTINLAYEAEIAVDSILVQYNAHWHSFCSLPAIIKEIKLIRTEVTKMWSENLALSPSSVVEPSKHLPTQHSNLMNDEEIVGFENDTKRIIRYLTRGTNELDVIPIVGMGGQGKTTCARKLYTNNIIVSHFDIRAWCVISQTYNWRELLQQILSQVTGSNEKGDKDEILADMLRKSLMGKRYLIVLDDMWDGMAWDDLRLCFPDVVNRSRIVVTTRLEKMGEHVKHHTDPYFLPFLTAEESCQLLQKKVFQQESCPLELQDVSQAVANRCKGLPLVVVLAAGIIKKKKMEESWWHEVEKALLFYLDRESEDYSRATMQLSYDNLPDYLRPCLLYMGMFPEDERIPVSRLISLWIAEGFVQNVESGRLMEEAAEDYLKELISSNVVMVSRRRYNGKVKYCQVHDIVLHFCLERSRQEKFMLAVKVHYTDFQPSDWNETRLSFNLTNELSEFALLSSKTRKPFYQKLRSLKTTSRYFHQLVNCNPLHQCRELRLLKVLDLSSNKVVPLSSATLEPLIHLKYLAVVVEQFDFHPRSLLPHLETLIVRYSSGDTVLPAVFWKMETLRHVEISHTIFDDFEDNEHWIFKESSKLENLRILRKVIIKDAANEDALIQRCPNLQELSISYESSGAICHKLESLTQLQILHLFFDSSLVVSKLHLPSNLKKLVLKGTCIKSTISFIAELPSLEYLQLHSSKFMKSEEWCLGDITFHKLKFLKLVDLGIVRWNASEECFPQLETLVIKVCMCLEEIPLSFADIPTLKQIKLMWCSKSLVASAVRIKEAVQDIEGCDRINISIDE